MSDTLPTPVIITDDFVDREHQLGLFNRVIQGQVDQRVFLLHGPEGIGKSYLLRELQAECAAASVPFVKVLPDKTQALNNMSITIHLIKALGLGSLEEFFKEINLSLAAQSLSEIPLAAPLAVDTDEAGGEEQKNLVLYGNVITGSAKNVSYENILQVIIQDHSKVREKASEVITGYLEKHLCVPSFRRTIFCLDPWEFANADDTTGKWLGSTLVSWILLGRVPGAVLIIAGSAVPDPGFLLSYTCDLPLSCLPDEAVKTYWVDKCHLPAEDVPQVIEGTNGIALALYLTAKSALFGHHNPMRQNAFSAPQSAEEDITEMAVDGLLSAIPPDLAQMIRLCAIPHWFNEGLFYHLAKGLEHQEALFQQITHMRFIEEEEKSHRFIFKAPVRQHLLAGGWWAQDRRKEYQAACRSMLDYDQAKESASPNPQKGSLSRERIYLQLAGDEVQGMKALYEAIETFARAHQYELMERLYGSAAELNSYLSAQSGLWLRFIAARMSWIKNQDAEIESELKNILAEAADPILQAACIHAQGSIFLYQHQWSNAAQRFKQALRLENAADHPFIALLTAFSLAETYRDLADTCDGLDLEQPGNHDRLKKLLDQIRSLPFHLLEQAVHRSLLMPDWYFGDNYQDWLLTYLRIEASYWYKRAAVHLKRLNDPSWTFDIELGLADVEHQLGRWALAKRRYARLGALEQVSSSPYRTALVEIGLGQVYAEEGRWNEAAALLEKSAPILDVFRDYTQAGNAFARLGLLSERLTRPDLAEIYYQKAVDAFHQANNPVQETQVADRLQGLGQPHEPSPAEPDASEPPASKPPASKPPGGEPPGQYISQFPGALLTWYRRIAVLGAAPVSFIFSFIIAVAAAFELNTLEGEIRLALAHYNSGTALSDALLILVVMILPVPLVLWIYRFIYWIFGLTVVYFQGRRLTPIEKGQPDVIKITAEDITYEVPLPASDLIGLNSALECKTRSMPWSAVSAVGYDDYYLFRGLIRLLSRTILVPHPAHGLDASLASEENKELIVEGITLGNRQIRASIADHVKKSQAQTRILPMEIVLLDLRWLAGIVLASALVVVYLLFTGQVTCQPYTNTSMGQTVYNCFGPFLMNLLPTIALALPAISIWRLLFHKLAVERALKLRSKTFPTWMLWLGAILSTLLLLAWLLIILQQSPAGPPESAAVFICHSNSW